MPDMTLLGIYLLVVNVVSFGLFGWDKEAAEAGARRIPEKTLLLVAALGGTPGAFLGQSKFRHKTQKQPFKALLFGVVAAQMALISTYLFGWL